MPNFTEIFSYSWTRVDLGGFLFVLSRFRWRMKDRWRAREWQNEKSSGRENVKLNVGIEMSYNFSNYRNFRSKCSKRIKATVWEIEQCTLSLSFSLGNIVQARANIKNPITKRTEWTYERTNERRTDGHCSRYHALQYAVLICAYTDT